VTCKSIARPRPKYAHATIGEAAFSFCPRWRHTTVGSGHVTCVFCRSSQSANGLAG
jgi:hypothetical protein